MALSLTTLAGASLYIPQAGVTACASSKVTVSSKIRKPKISAGNVYSNKINIKIGNIKDYSNTAEFEIFCGNKRIKTVKATAVKKSGCISVLSDGKNYVKANKTYTFKIRAKGINGVRSKFSAVKVKTAARTYYKIDSKVKLYKLSGGKMKYTGKKTSDLQYITGKTAFENGRSTGGKSITKKQKYVYLTSGENKGCYVSVSNAKRLTEREAKIHKVVKYAVGMNGGSYVWGGEQYRATDCSGLTMLAYKQVGVNITHSTYVQASKGKANTVKNIKPGDVIICNGYGHAALYIGGGKIIHAMSPSYGIRIQHISNLRYCGAINTVRTILP